MVTARHKDLLQRPNMEEKRPNMEEKRPNMEEKRPMSL